MIFWKVKELLSLKFLLIWGRVPDHEAHGKIINLRLQNLDVITVRQMVIFFFGRHHFKVSTLSILDQPRMKLTKIDCK